MFCYLSKKIAVPNQAKAHALSWNPEKGWIACGGEDGLLKVLKLDQHADAPPGGASSTAPAPSSLSMNQTLEGHSGTVTRCAWNAGHDKLATSDDAGLIIVWTLHNGVFCEEMINNRNRSAVVDMKWSPDGTRICIVYRDGHVIVGSVEGGRLWGQELALPLRFLSWTPDGKSILFATAEGVEVYDSQGSALKSMLLDKKRGTDGGAELAIVAMDWHDKTNGLHDQDAPTLAIVYSNGDVELRRGIDDRKPALLQSAFSVSSCQWSPNGSVLALAGVVEVVSSKGERRKLNMIKCFSPYGVHFRNMKLPGSDGISALTWEGNGLRLALAVDGSVYFANILPPYKWTLVGSTVVYAFCKADSSCGVMFWNSEIDERRIKFVRGVHTLESAGDCCLLVERSRELDEKQDGREQRCVLNLLDSTGSALDTKCVSIDPICVSMSTTHVIISDRRNVYVWQYFAVSQSPDEDAAAKQSLSYRAGSGRERWLDSNDRGAHPAKTTDNYVFQKDQSSDPIGSVCVFGSALCFVATESGCVFVYALPTLSPVGQFKGPGYPSALRVNCDSTQLGITDKNGTLRVYDIITLKEGTGSSSREVAVGQIGTERKDAWALEWSRDEPHAFATIEKNKLRIFNSADMPPDEPIISNGTTLLKFENLEVSLLSLDDIMNTPEEPTPASIRTNASGRLLKAKNVIEASSTTALSYLRDDPHSNPCLWRLLAERSLVSLDLATAQKAFVELQDYRGIQFTRHVADLGDKARQNAEVAVFYKRFGDAETLYREIDRLDLAIALRARIGDWFRVVALVEEDGGGDCEMLRRAWAALGKQYADKYQWGEAAAYYSKANDLEMAANCLYRGGDYVGLESLIGEHTEGDPSLRPLATLFKSVGMCKQAVQCYSRIGDSTSIKMAIDTCIILNCWEDAVRLSREAGFNQIDGVVSKRAHELLSSGNKFKAVELFRKADRPDEAASLLSEIAQDAVSKGADPLLVKKLFVLSAKEVEQYRDNTLDVTSMATTKGTSMAATTIMTIDSIMSTDAESRGHGLSAQVLTNAWRGAAAYHYFALAHHQLYGGKVQEAMFTAIRCCAFADVLGSDVFFLLALAAFRAGYLGVCSTAFTKLETQGLEESTSKKIQKLAVQVFTRFPPADDRQLPRCYTECLQTGSPYDACVATGRSVLNERTMQCKICHHFVIESAAGQLSSCPLCHSHLAVDEALVTILEDDDEDTDE